jgi:hypothetical protein
MIHLLQMLEESIEVFHFLQIELNKRFLHMLQQSIKVSLIAVTVEQLIYLLLSRCADPSQFCR